MKLNKPGLKWAILWAWMILLNSVQVEAKTNTSNILDNKNNINIINKQDYNSVIKQLEHDENIINNITEENYTQYDELFYLSIILKDYFANKNIDEDIKNTLSWRIEKLANKARYFYEKELTLENKNNTQQDKITWDNLNELEKLIN